MSWTSFLIPNNGLNLMLSVCKMADLFPSKAWTGSNHFINNGFVAQEINSFGSAAKSKRNSSICIGASQKRVLMMDVTFQQPND